VTTIATTPEAPTTITRRSAQNLRDHYTLVASLFDRDDSIGLDIPLGPDEKPDAQIGLLDELLTYDIPQTAEEWRSLLEGLPEIAGFGDFDYGVEHQASRRAVAESSDVRRFSGVVVRDCNADVMSFTNGDPTNGHLYTRIG
jgi:hypothetical protein